MTTFADDFNRADSSNLGAGWVEVSGDWSIVSNQLSPGNATGTILLRAATDATTDDNFAQITIAATTAASQGVACRTNANLSTGYLWRNNGSSWDLFTLGTFVQLATYAVAAAPGDVAKVQAVGSTIKAFVNGIERASVTDTTYATGKSSGVRAESVSALRFDNFSSGDVAGSTVNGTIDQAYGGLGGGVTATREVPASAAQAYAGLSGGVSGAREAIGGVSQALGGLSGGVSGVREVPAAAAQAFGALGGGVAGDRETFGTAAFAGGGFAGHVAGSTGGALKHANASVIARAWLAQLADVPRDGSGRPQVAMTLPEPAKWWGTGFITVGPIFPGAPELYVPLQHPVVQIDCWAAWKNSKKPNYQANELAEIVRAGADATILGDVPVLELPPDVMPVWLSDIRVIRGVTWIPDPNYTHYSLDLHIGWIEREALAGVAG